MATKNFQLPRAIGRSLNFATGRANALCQKILDPHGLTLPQWVILSCLWREGELTVGELADIVGTGLPATSRIIDRMVERKLVERRKHKTDGRVMIIKSSAAGDDLRHLADFYEQINKALFKGMSDAEQKQAFDLLRRMRENAEHALDAD